ncbi:endolytic transglycosylase MltG [Actinobacillus equuli]|uniref:Endolytic murein transglycosylase n=1 Tax=Actinobacillus equuli TaxID=718 RepID=A0AAX3FJ45_ACTEU|nr:endolytic transglycosylase MltG [Actinobacillus equuli]AIZ79852.1 aminodeoxychorismate lyase [Actinobacillus equuli subsp. equuli]MDG4953083.1 endolytic transglycosylase MltG [Actinobacillus equuli subsp. equuli]WGE43966.1 endolytic transglycosylase MltG [Actinobacillus equuli subsp. equuli]WGE64874.1 endolytic transglycosylase MltG [Actinobacillus equuli subsp. equuli]WGE78849.1 endolytic transglycosylase MltG [Actinobacillus equuli subsp. equuli]
MIKKFLISLGLIGIIALGGAFYGYQKLSDLAKHPITAKADQFFLLEKGTSSQKLAQLLEEQGIVNHDDVNLLPYLMRFKPELSKFKAGTYSLNGLNTVEDLLKHFSSGKEVQLNVQFIEGKTFKVWREQLAQASYMQHTLNGKSEAEIAQLLGIAHEKLEGWIAPDTYSYVPNSNDLELLKRAYQKQQKALDNAWQNRAENLPLASPYEMLILASIVEKETAVASERPQVASVFINRLRLKMKLQTDPTVIYGMGDRYNGNIRRKDLEEATPYNTYVIDGLPPTPIAMPSEAALKAVSQPDNTPYLYFVADGSGGHKFSKTLNEHNQAVREWIKIERNKRLEKK